MNTVVVNVPVRFNCSKGGTSLVNVFYNTAEVRFDRNSEIIREKWQIHVSKVGERQIHSEFITIIAMFGCEKICIFITKIVIMATNPLNGNRTASSLASVE